MLKVLNYEAVETIDGYPWTHPQMDTVQAVCLTEPMPTDNEKSAPVGKVYDGLLDTTHE